MAAAALLCRRRTASTNPGSDVLDWLHVGARAGGRAERMAFGRGQLDNFGVAIQNIVAQQHKPKAILLSGGGTTSPARSSGS